LAPVVPKTLALAERSRGAQCAAAVSQPLLLIVIMLSGGYACARLRVLPSDAADAFQAFVIYVCLPATIWKLMPQLQFQPELWLLAAVPWALLTLSALLLVGLSRALGWSRSVTGALLLCVPLGNTSFLGFPLISALLGESALRYAVLYDQLGSFLALSTFGIVVAARYGSGDAYSLRATLLRIARFPPTVALLLAFTPLPRFAILQPLWARLSDVLVPLAMFAVGLRLTLRLPRPRSAFFAGLGIKLGLMPALAWAFARAVQAPPTLTQVIVLEAGMPPMISAGVVAAAAGLAPELAAGLVGYGVLLGLVVLPAWAALLLR
jgi:predicted permease